MRGGSAGGWQGRMAKARGQMRSERLRRTARAPRSRGVARSRDRGWVFEIFASVQGEGIYVGERQLFVRMAGCSATCSWCDTVSSKKRRAVCAVHGARKRTLENPLTVGRTVAEIHRLIEENGPIHTVSLTGGEPLEQSDFVGALAQVLKREGYRVYLDTNGLETDGIRSVIRHVDVVAMDIKLPSATGSAHWEVHRAFLRALEGVDVFVKIVVAHSTRVAELEAAVRLIAEHDKRTPLVLQPEGSALFKGTGRAAARRRVLVLTDHAQRYALERLEDVRVVPQCHKLLKLR
jgi:7-carboxy-7-deazaguanine synthase